jgi:hypothetical protein
VADIWKEAHQPKRKGLAQHDAAPTPLMYEFPSPPALPQTLLPQETWFVRACSFTFAFHSREQLEACLAYYRRKIHPSSLIPAETLGGGDHWEFQRWFERLPAYLLEEPKRKKVVAALSRALVQMAADHSIE